MYCDWNKRDSLLVSKTEFIADLQNSYTAMAKFNIKAQDARFFLPPYEWYNDSISCWTKQLGLTLINYTPGTLSTADYTTPEMKNYRSSDTIYRSIVNYEKSRGLNGFILLMHIGTDSARTDKMYRHLGELITHLKTKGYRLQRVDALLNDGNLPPK